MCRCRAPSRVKLLRDRDGIGAVNGLRLGAALLQPHHLAAAQIDGRINMHALFRICARRVKSSTRDGA